MEDLEAAGGPKGTESWPKVGLASPPSLSTIPPMQQMRRAVLGGQLPGRRMGLLILSVSWQPPTQCEACRVKPVGTPQGDEVQMGGWNIQSLRQDDR